MMDWVDILESGGEIVGEIILDAIGLCSPCREGAGAPGDQGPYIQTLFGDRD
jgi:hypothetical protein